MKELLTELNDRVLRFDGVSIVDSSALEILLVRGAVPSQLRVLDSSAAIDQFNALVSEQNRVKVYEPEPIAFRYNWQLPAEYLSLDVEEHVSVVFGERLSKLKYDATQTETAINRVAQELQMFRERGLIDLLRTIIYILHRFKETDQIWGVGRGSSCASYILFLLGLHVVDPVKHNVDLSEFMHE